VEAVQPTLGASLAGVPDLAVAEDADHLVGVSFDKGVPRVTRYQVSTQVVRTVVRSPWDQPFTSTAGIALIR